MLWAPFMENRFLLDALVAGVLVSIMCACVGTFVVLRGFAFVGDALAHGMLPGIAVAAIVGAPLVAGAAAGAFVMLGGVRAVRRRTRLSADTSVGLLFVGMLGLGVVIASRSSEFRGDLSGVLFGDILAVGGTDMLVLGIAAGSALVVTAVLHRPFLLLAVDPDLAATSGFAAARHDAAMMVLVGAAVVTSFRAAGTLLVLGMLVAPAATAALVARRLPTMIALAAAVGSVSTWAGLLLSYHLDLAAGASVVVVAVACFVVVLLSVTLSSHGEPDREVHRGHGH